MATCDGCKTAAISWKFNGAGIIVGDQMAVPFTLNGINTSLTAHLRSRGYMGTAATGKIDNAPVYCMCPACWKGMASVWGKKENKSAAVYEPARAKTDSSAVFLQTEDPAFHKNTAVPTTGQPQLEPIVSCLVHEIIHYWSYGSVGVQQFNRDEGVEWDEVLCDFFAYPTYKNLFAGNDKLKNYVGPYSTNSKFLERSVSFWESNMNLKRIYDEFLNKPGERQKLPKPVAEYFTKLAAKTPASAPGLGFPKPPGPVGPPPAPGMVGPPPAPGMMAPPPAPGMMAPPPAPGMGGPPSAPGMGVPPSPMATGAAPGLAVKPGTESKKLYEDSLFDYMATWFFQGPSTTKDGFQFPTFIRNSDVVFQKKGSVFVSFGETATPI